MEGRAAIVTTMLKTLQQQMDEKASIAKYNHEESITRRNRCHPGILIRIFKYKLQWPFA